jgi:hypothetical protein
MHHNPVLTAAERAAQSWRQEAEERRRISKSDPVADTLDYCAGELAVRLREAERADESLTVEQFARLADVDVTPQTVRAWIRRGELPATLTPKGWKIPRAARRVVRARQSA